MKQLRNILTGVLLACGLSLPAVSMQADSIPAAQNGLVAELDSMAQRDDVTPAEQEENTVDVKEIVFGHIGDSYEWHITDFGETKVIIPLPVIVYSGTTGLARIPFFPSGRERRLLRGTFHCSGRQQVRRKAGGARCSRQ